MDQVGSLLNRPKFYYNIDGVGELGCGFMCLGFALLLWLQVHSPSGAIWHQMYAFVIYMAVMLSIIHYGTKAIKNHITYPRTGFVEYRKRNTVWRPGIIAAFISPLALGGLFVAHRYHWNMTASVPLFGLLLAASYGYGIARAVRWKWVVVWAMTLVSFVIAFLPASSFDALADDSWVTHPVRTKLVGAFLLYLMIYGGMLLISGGISFWLYLRHTQAPAQESQ
jgi:hypothetical protein